MEFIVNNWVLLLVAFASGGLLVWPLVAKGSRAGTLSPVAAVQLINREKAVVVDVGEPDEYARGHIVGSRNIPFGQLEQQLPSAVKNKATVLLFSCPTGARAKRAQSEAAKLGYTNTQTLGGGNAAWLEASLPLEKPAVAAT